MRLVLLLAIVAVVAARPTEKRNSKSLIDLLEELSVRAMKEKGAMGGKGPKPKPPMAGKGGEGEGDKGGEGEGDKDGDKDGAKKLASHFNKALWYLTKVLSYYGPADPKHADEAMPEIIGMLKALKGVVDQSAADLKALKGASDPSTVSARIAKLGAELKEASKMEKLTQSDISQFLFQVLFNGVKGAPSCGSLLGSLIELGKKRKEAAENPTANAISPEEQAKQWQELKEKLEAAGVADLECVAQSLAGLIKKSEDVKDNPPATAAELESALGQGLLASNKLGRDIKGALTGWGILAWVYSHIPKPAPTAAPEVAEKRELKDELEMLMKILAKN